MAYQMIYLRRKMHFENIMFFNFSWCALPAFLQHPVLDEPIAEAVCIIADTDKWTVQVATSQRKMTDNMKLGKDILVSSQVSALLQSILQLYKLNLPADFVSTHLQMMAYSWYWLTGKLGCVTGFWAVDFTALTLDLMKDSIVQGSATHSLQARSCPSTEVQPAQSLAWEALPLTQTSMCWTRNGLFGSQRPYTIVQHRHTGSGWAAPPFPIWHAANWWGLPSRALWKLLLGSRQFMVTCRCRTSDTL